MSEAKETYKRHELENKFKRHLWIAIDNLKVARRNRDEYWIKEGIQQAKDALKTLEKIDK